MSEERRIEKLRRENSATCDVELLQQSLFNRPWGLTLWTFWQNAAQLHIYGSQANTLVDNAGVIQAFGARNLRMAQDYANMVGGISADQVINMKPEEQLLLIEGRNLRCRQVRYYKDEFFQTELQKTT